MYLRKFVQFVVAPKWYYTTVLNKSWALIILLLISTNRIIATNLHGIKFITCTVCVWSWKKLAGLYGYANKRNFCITYRKWFVIRGKPIRKLGNMIESHLCDFISMLYVFMLILHISTILLCTAVFIQFYSSSMCIYIYSKAFSSIHSIRNNNG